MSPTLEGLVRRSRRPPGLLARMLLWPTLVLLLSDAAAGTEDDALASGLLALVVVVSVCGLLAAVDGFVLRRREVVLVWSVTVLVVGVAFEAATLPTLVRDGQLTWRAALHELLADLPYGLPVTVVGLAGPVLLGALVGRLLRRRPPDHDGSGALVPGSSTGV